MLWTVNRFRFYTPLDQIVAAPRDACPPRRPRLGFWVTVIPDEATSSVPVEMIEDLPGYGAHCLPDKDIRNRIRRAARRVQLVAITDPDILLAQGWDLETWASARNGKPIPASAAGYRAQILRRFRVDPQLVVAAMDDVELVGYTLSHAIGTMMRMTENVLGQRGRDLDVGVLLVVGVAATGHHAAGNPRRTPRAVVPGAAKPAIHQVAARR